MRLLVALCAMLAVVVASGAPTVRLSTGLLQGQVNGAANQYLGVPYAQPPVGPLRWKRPQPPVTWSGTRQAINWQNACWQANQQSIPQSEDCLYVNVWTPTNANNASNLPVMYWIHGGGWEFGSPIGFYGNNISSQYNVVVVTVAYRLGALGFLAEPHLLQTEPFLGALGIMDQQAGLKWVQANIAAFGGNPNRVTIYGESAGGGSVGIHMTIPSSKGLFRNAISESGVFFYPTIADMVPQALALSEAVHCANVADPAACLMALPPSTINLALPVDGDIILGFRNNSYGVHWYPIIDGTFLTGQPINLAIKGSINAKNVIIGTNGQEGNGFVLPYFNYGQLSKEQFEFWVNQSYGSSFIAAAYTTYASDIQTGNYVQALADMANDFWFQCQRLLLAGATAAAGVPTYTYLFSYPYTAPGQPNIGATHADEVAFVWDDVAGMHFNSSEAALAGWMSSSWAAFATSDDPNGAKLPVQWPLRSAKNEQPINFNLQLSVLPSAYRQTYCNMWNPTLVAGAWPISLVSQ